MPFRTDEWSDAEEEEEDEIEAAERCDARTAKVKAEVINAWIAELAIEAALVKARAEWAQAKVKETKAFVVYQKARAAFGDYYNTI